MNKANANYTINLLAACLGVLITSTGLLLYLSLPHGSKGLTILGMTRHGRGELHLWLGIALFLTIIIHLFLHLSWIKAVLTTNRSKVPSLASSVGLVLILLFLAISITLPLLTPTGEAGPQGMGRPMSMGRG